MRRKQKEIRFEEEAPKLIVGQPVPLSCRYFLGTKAKLLALVGETAILVFPDGARLENVPVRDLVDDSGYWKR